MYRGLRVSGRKWSHFKEEIGVPVEGVEQELRQSVQSVVDRMTALSRAADLVGELQGIFADPGFVSQVDQSCAVEWPRCAPQGESSPAPAEDGSQLCPQNLASL